MNYLLIAQEACKELHGIKWKSYVKDYITKVRPILVKYQNKDIENLYKQFYKEDVRGENISIYNALINLISYLDKQK